MLKPSDLDNYVALYQQAVALGALDGESAEGVLPEREDGLFWMEIRRLEWSLHILAVLEDRPSQLVATVHWICERNRGGVRFAGLEHTEIWLKAIRSALRHAEPRNDAELRAICRQTEVGMACRRLRSRGYGVEMNAYGPSISIGVQQQISKQINNLLSQLGENVVIVILDWMLQQQRFHDGMWLFGTRIAGYGQIKSPSLPVGWLTSMAIRQFGKKCTARSPEKVWQRVAELSTDLAAAMDAERYNSFEQMNLSPTEFWRSLVDSLHWREMFSVPQAPGVVVSRLADALRSINWPPGSSDVSVKAIRLAAQCEEFLRALDDQKPIRFTKAWIMRQFPMLSELGCTKVTDVNRAYDSPLAMTHRDHDKSMLFEVDAARVFALPRAMTTAAACHVIISFLHRELTKPLADKVVGDTIEKIVELACAGKVALAVTKKTYKVGRSGPELEIDVATLDDGGLVLFETKAKTLTAQARSGDMRSYVYDYTSSYLRLLGQLTAHEDNLREGRVSLREGWSHDSEMPLLKVAVTPLSFGPLSDPHLANAMLRAIAYATLTPVNSDPRSEEVWKDFNGRKDKIVSHIATLAPKNERGEADFVRYLRTVRWLDIGQFLYLMDRSPSVSEAMRPLNVVFSTQDFWSEIAEADRRGIGVPCRPARRSEKASI